MTTNWHQRRFNNYRKNAFIINYLLLVLILFAHLGVLNIFSRITCAGINTKKGMMKRTPSKLLMKLESVAKL